MSGLVADKCCAMYDHFDGMQQILMAGQFKMSTLNMNGRKVKVDSLVFTTGECLGRERERVSSNSLFDF